MEGKKMQKHIISPFVLLKWFYGFSSRDFVAASALMMMMFAFICQFKLPGLNPEVYN
jgi:hypothetical protein